MTRSMSTFWPSESEMALEGVEGEMATAERMLLAWMRSTKSEAESVGTPRQRKLERPFLLLRESRSCSLDGVRTWVGESFDVEGVALASRFRHRLDPLCFQHPRGQPS